MKKEVKYWAVKFRGEDEYDEIIVVEKSKDAAVRVAKMVRGEYGESTNVIGVRALTEREIHELLDNTIDGGII